MASHEMDDEGDQLVTAFPLPPNYFRSLSSGEEIRRMTPPPLSTDISTFGSAIRRNGSWVFLHEQQAAVEGDPLEIPAGLEERVALLKELKGSLLLNYMQLLELLASRSSGEAFDQCQGNFQKCVNGISRVLQALRAHQVIILIGMCWCCLEYANEL
jgi:hypothetical protein